MHNINLTGIPLCFHEAYIKRCEQPEPMIIGNGTSFDTALDFDEERIKPCHFRGDGK